MDLSYVAGFFDGEGSIGVYHHVNGGVQTGFHLRVQLRQNKTDLSSRLFERLVARYGGCIGEFPTRSGKVGMSWQVGSARAVKFLREIEPHLILKKDQARLAVSWQEGRIPAYRDKRGRISSHSKEVRDRDLAVCEALKMMKNGSSVEAVVSLQGDLVDLVGRFTPKIVRMDAGGGPRRKRRK
ncbi:MAG: hypothetical protein H0U91_14635 [Rubrobacter sp.]|nr:hypothetical protein [Rubrobacter sp.]